VKKIAKRLTYANVMSSIAVFLVLGGATALAAGLAKNSVGSKQIKKNAVTTAKIKNGAVTTSKIKNGAITGAQVNASTLGTVPNANHAANADTANSAKTADNANHAGSADNAGSADSLNGITLRRIFYKSSSTSSQTQVLSLDGLTLTATCDSGEPVLTARTSVGNSLIRTVTTNNGDETFYDEEDDFDPGETFDVLEGETDSAQATFTFANPGGQVVTGIVTAEEEDFDDQDCALLGNVTG
jgi:hypothetical protein